VWTALYVMIAAAGWLVWRAGERGRALGFWTANVIANGLWSWLFFGLRMPAIAFADILVIWATIVGFIVAAWSRSRTASLLFVPYLVWVSYASALNLAIWQMNR
jgi:tryptophan-rich sensory protein